MDAQRQPSRPEATIRRTGRIFVLACLLGASGCGPDKPSNDRRVIPEDAETQLDRSFVRDPFTNQAEAAVLRERALHDSDFLAVEGNVVLEPVAAR